MEEQCTILRCKTDQWKSSVLILRCKTDQWKSSVLILGAICISTIIDEAVWQCMGICTLSVETNV